MPSSCVGMERSARLLLASLSVTSCIASIAGLTESKPVSRVESTDGRLGATVGVSECEGSSGRSSGRLSQSIARASLSGVQAQSQGELEHEEAKVLMIIFALAKLTFGRTRGEVRDPARPARHPRAAE